MMRRALIALVMLASSTQATDPASARLSQKTAPKAEYRPNIYPLLAAAAAENRERERIADLIDLVAATRPQLEQFILRMQAAKAIYRVSGIQIQPQKLPDSLPID